MEKINHYELEHSSAYSTPTSIITYPLLWNHFGCHLHDQDSSSTQSTGQSHQEAAGLTSSNAQFQFVSSQTGYETDAKKADSDMKSVLSLGTSELICSAPKTDHIQSIACIPFSYSDPYSSGTFAAYGQHSIIHPQMTGRALLPLAEDGPIYVNAKQFHAILRRRQLRAKLEAQNRVAKVRKPYLHESRHLHAMKRVRGSDGRFLNTKLLQLRKEQRLQLKSDAKSISSYSPLELDRRGKLSGPIHLHLRNGDMSTSVQSSTFEITGISNTSGMFHLPDHLRYSEFHSHVGGGMQSRVNNAHNGSQQRVSAIK